MGVNIVKYDMFRLLAVQIHTLIVENYNHMVHKNWIKFK